MFDTIRTKISNAWGTLWAWMYNSGTVAWNYIWSAAGAAVTTVAAMDFSSLLGLERKQAYVMGGAMFVQGFLQNIIRMSGTKVVDNHLLPTAEAMKAEEVKVETVPVSTASKEVKAKKAKKDNK